MEHLFTNIQGLPILKYSFNIDYLIIEINYIIRGALATQVLSAYFICN
jgi:hypothetical protein